MNSPIGNMIYLDVNVLKQTSTGMTLNQTALVIETKEVKHR